MADNGSYFNDYRQPFSIADQATVTLSTTDKALYPLAAAPYFGSQYWTVGKKMKIRLFGKITTGTTPGNLTFDVYYGSGADANGTIIVSSAAVALVASQTNLSWWLEVLISCRSQGSAGTLFGTGIAHFNVAEIASTNQPILIPASAAAASSAVDLTSSSSIISVQAKRSGSTAETMTVQDYEFIALN